MVWQVCVDHSRYIWSCTDALYGAVNDMSVTETDQYVKAIREGRLFKEVTFQVYDSDGILRTCKGVYFIVDGGYGQFSCLIPPIAYRTEMTDIYWSEFLESVRKDVECTFGILKMRWFILRKGFQFQSAKVFDNTFKTCCILHNMILKWTGQDLSSWENVCWADLDVFGIDLDDDEFEVENNTPGNNVFTDNYVDLIVTEEDMNNAAHATLAQEAEPDETVIRLNEFHVKRKLLVDHFTQQFRKGDVHWTRGLRYKDFMNPRDLDNVPNRTMDTIVQRVQTEANARGIDTRLFDSTRNIQLEKMPSLLRTSEGRTIGNGLFTKSSFKRDERIATFRGTMQATTDYDMLPENCKGYAHHINKDIVLNCFEAMRRGECLASLANSATNTVNINDGLPAKGNAYITKPYWDTLTSKFVISLKASRNIVATENSPVEIVVGTYGRNFFNNMTV